LRLRRHFFPLFLIGITILPSVLGSLIYLRTTALNEVELPRLAQTDDSWILPLNYSVMNFILDSNRCIYLAGPKNLTKFDSTMNMLWSTEYQSNYTHNNVLLTTSSMNDIILAPDAIEYYYLDAPNDIIFYKFNSTGEVLWNRTWGISNAYEDIYDIATDLEDNIYIYGCSLGLEYNITKFILKYNSTGDLLWYHVLATYDHEFDWSQTYDGWLNCPIQVDSNNNMIITSQNYTGFWIQCLNSSRELEWSISREIESGFYSSYEKFAPLILDSQDRIITFNNRFVYKYDGNGKLHKQYSLDLKSRYLLVDPSIEFIPMNLALGANDTIYFSARVSIHYEDSNILILKLEEDWDTEDLILTEGREHKMQVDHLSNVFLLSWTWEEGDFLIKNPKHNGDVFYNPSMMNFFIISLSIFGIIAIAALAGLIIPKVIGNRRLRHTNPN